MTKDLDITMEDINLIDVEKVFASKNAKMLRYIPRFFISYLKRIVHQDDINEFLIKAKDIKGIEYAKAIIDKFNPKVSIHGLENIPDEGRFIFASNHPLGGLDGMIFIDAVGKKFRDIKFPVNDILMNITNFGDIFLPINKHGATGREAAARLDAAFASDSQILMFPAGMVSRKTKGVIKDGEWKRTFVTKAITHHRDIIPVYISGQNSAFFYNMHNFRKIFGIKLNIEMLYLPDEMYKQNGKKISITFGKPFAWNEFSSKHAQETAEKLKEMTYSLAKND